MERRDWPTFLSAPLLPAVLLLVALLLLLLPLSSHLLQLLPVFPLDEALLMSHLWEVIWRGGKTRGAGEQIKREKVRKGRERQGRRSEPPRCRRRGCQFEQIRENIAAILQLNCPHVISLIMRTCGEISRASFGSDEI